MDDSQGEKGILGCLIREISLQDCRHGVADAGPHMPFQADWQAEYEGLCLKLFEDNIFPCDFDQSILELEVESLPAEDGLALDGFGLLPRIVF